MQKTNRLARITAAMTLILMGAAGHAAADTFTAWTVLKAPVLSSPQRGLVRREVERIWSPYGIKVEWHDRLPTFGESPGIAVTVVVDDGQMLSRNPIGRQVLGEVVIVGDTMLRHIAVSPRGTRQIVSGAVSSQDSLRFSVVHARFIGRVIAHELGHLLLRSREHAGAGLMRALFDWRDAIKDDSRAFHLEASDLALLAERTPSLTARAANLGAGR